MASDELKPVKRYDCTSGGAKFCQGCYTMTERELGDYVGWEDFDTLAQRLQEAERLQAQASDLLRDLCEGMRACGVPGGPYLEAAEDFLAGKP